MDFTEFQGHFKKDITKKYQGKNKKNIYYKSTDLKKAWQLANDFFNKKYNPILLKNGNLKLQKNVIIWDMPSIVTCKGACSNCYALKSERIYKNTRVMRAFHFAIVLLALENKKNYSYLLNCLDNEIKKHGMCYKLPVVRIHASGDFFNKKYLKLWVDLILQNKNIKFYSYSKQLENDLIDLINKILSNFNIVKSIIDNQFINFGNEGYIQKIAEFLNNKNEDYYICKYGTDQNHDTCMGTCSKCLRCSNILFHKH